MKKSFVLPMLAVLVAVPILTACGARPATDIDDADSTIQIYAASYPVYYFAKEVAGRHAVITSLDTSGEVHLFEPSPGMIGAVRNSDGVLYLDANFETWIGTFRELVPDVPFHAVGADSTSGLETGGLERREHESSAVPHIWLAPQMAIQIVRNIDLALARIDPANATYYRIAAEAMQTRLSELHQRYREGLRACTLSSFVTPYASFTHMAEAYGLINVGIGGSNHHHELSAATIVSAIEFIRTQAIGYLLVDPLSSDTLAQTVATEAGIELRYLDPLEVGTADGSQNSYFERMQVNLANLQIALGCAGG